MAVVPLFEAIAGSYDQARRRLVPGFDDFYGTAVEVAAPPLRRALAQGREPAVLDLGAGTGLLSLLLAIAVPGVRLTLVDGAPAMLAVAERHLAERNVPYRTVVSDLGQPLPDGPYDAVVSALAIHHLDDAGKRALYRRVHEALMPGGVFVNAEQVAAPTPALDRRYDEIWLEQITALGATVEEIAGARQRMAHDLPAAVPDQCRWLVESGFAEVDCFYKAWRFAVFGGSRR